MDKNTTTTPRQRNDKGRDFKAQKQIVFDYWLTHTATMSMVSAKTGVPQKNITRYVADFRDEKRITLICKTHCKITGFRAGFYSTNPEQIGGEKC